jgi:hypothetical protein
MIDPEFKWRMIYGFCLVFCLVSLAGMLALGKVDEKFSFGLRDVILILAQLGGAFGAWFAASRQKSLSADKEQVNPPEDKQP